MAQLCKRQVHDHKPNGHQVEEVEVLSDVGSRDRDSEASVLLAVASWEE